MIKTWKLIVIIVSIIIVIITTVLVVLHFKKKSTDKGEEIKGFLKIIYADVAAASDNVWSKGFADTFLPKIKDRGYNVIILGMLTPEIDPKSADLVGAWLSQTKLQMKQSRDFLEKNNMKILASIGGGTVTWEGKGKCNCDFDNIEKLVSPIADGGFDGMDLDIEWIMDINTCKTKGGNPKTCITNLQEIVKYIRDGFKKYNKQAIVSSAPQPPYFTNPATYALDYNEYEKQSQNNPDYNIDFYNIQFYNNNCGNGDITKNKGSDTCPSTDMINKYGIPKNKIILGKCGVGGACCSENEYIGGKQAVKWAEKAGLKGVMFWEYNACTTKPGSDNWLEL